MPEAPPTSSRPSRTRRDREDIRERLIDAALVEFGEKGFDAASTRSIARRIDAHQPQINYHFESKEALWTAAVDHLFGLLLTALAPAAMPGSVDRLDTSSAVSAIAAVSTAPGDTEAAEHLAATFADLVRRFVRFAAAHPELNRIMVHEATAPSDRLTWMTEQHVRPLYEGIRPLWRHLRDAGIAAPIDESMVHYVLVGAASLPYVNAPEAELLLGVDPTDPALVDAYAESLVATLLPGRPPAGG